MRTALPAKRRPTARARLITLTPNPALDLSGHVEGVVLDEKNYVHRPRLDPGGNGINAARMIARLGREVTAYGWLGGPAGDEIQTRLYRSDPGVKQAFTLIQGNTRTNVTVTDDVGGHQTRFTFPGPELREAERRRLHTPLKRISGPGILLCAGSLPEGCPIPFVSRLLDQAARRGLGVAVDVPAVVLGPLLAATRGRLLLLKPNRSELTELAGRPLPTLAEVVAAASELLPRSAIVCASLGEDGALLVTAQGRWLARAPQLRARGSVGSGDAMVGGLLVRLAHHGLVTPAQVDAARASALEDILRWGVAAGAATALAEGTALGLPRDVRRLAARIQLRRL